MPGLVEGRAGEESKPGEVMRGGAGMREAGLRVGIWEIVMVLARPLWGVGFSSSGASVGGWKGSAEFSFDRDERKGCG